MALRQSGAWLWASASRRLVANSQGGWELVRGSRQERHCPIGGLRMTSGGHGSSCFAGAKRRQGLVGGGGAQATASMWRSIVCTRDSAKGSRDPGPHTWDTPGYNSWVASPVVMDAHHGWRCSARTTSQCSSGAQSASTGSNGTILTRSNFSKLNTISKLTKKRVVDEP